MESTVIGLHICYLQCWWKQIYVEADWQPDRQIDRLTDRKADRQPDWLTDRLTDWKADRMTDRLTDWKADRMTDRQRRHMRDFAHL